MRAEDAPSSAGDSPRAEPEAEHNFTMSRSSESTATSVKREGSDEAEELDQLDEESQAPAAESDTRPASPAPAVEALVALPTTGVKTQNAQFVHKLFAMVQTPSLRSLISWADSGLSFSVFNPTEFSREVLPQFFKHNNFQSFVRQLNMYGFHKVNDMLGTVLAGTDGVIAWEFQHPSFQRDRPELLARIKRKSSKTGAASTNPPSPAAPPPITRKSSQVASSTPSVRPRSATRDKPPSVLASEEAPTTPAEAAPTRPMGVVVPEGGYFERPVPIPGRASGTFHRVKAERDSPRRHSPPSLPPVNPYPHPNPRLSPRNAPYPLPSAPYPSSLRPQTANDGLSRQLAGLEAQVRSMGEALHYSQQENQAGRIATYSVMRLLLDVVEGLDSSDARKEDLHRCQVALAQLVPPQFSPSAGPPPGSSSGPFAYSPFSTTAPWQPYGGGPPPAPPSSSGRPSHSSAGAASQFFFQRPSAVESFTRGAGAIPTSSSRRGSRDESASPYPSSFNPLPTPSSSEPSSFPSRAEGRDSSSSQGFASRPLSSGLFSNGGSHSYPSPRTSWQSGLGSAGGRPGAEGAAPPPTLPPISALFGAGDTLPGRRPMGMDGEDSDEARKKARRA